MGTHEERPLWAVAREQEWKRQEAGGLETAREIAIHAGVSVDFLIRRLKQLGFHAPSGQALLAVKARKAVLDEIASGRLHRLAEVDAACGRHGVSRGSASRILDLAIRVAKDSMYSEDELIDIIVRKGGPDRRPFRMDELGVPLPGRGPSQATPVRSTSEEPQQKDQTEAERQDREQVLARNREEAAKRFAAQRAAKTALAAGPAPEESATARPAPQPAAAPLTEVPEPVARMREVLDEFAPARYPDLFAAWSDCLDLAGEDPITAGPAGERLIRAALGYKFGLFGYKPAAAAIHDAARRAISREPGKVRDSAVKLRPMLRGLLTDLSRSQFVFWDVDLVPALAAVTFADLEAWLDELGHGRPAQMKAQHTVISRAEGAALALARFLAAAGENLRKGYRSAPAPRREPRTQTNGGGQARGGREMGYRAEKEWLVPIRISGGEVFNDLPDWLMEQAGGRAAHQVREFRRRPPGSAADAERSVYVSAHVRGGGAFAPKHSLPTVTVLSR